MYEMIAAVPSSLHNIVSSLLGIDIDERDVRCPKI